MNMVQVYIKGQEDKELNSFFRYYPVRIKNIGMDAFFDRQVIFDFKDGRNHTEVAKCVAKMLVKKSVARFVMSFSLVFLQAARNETRLATSISPNLYAGYRVPLMVFHM